MKDFKTFKWKVGAISFLCALHFWPVLMRRPSPSHGLKKRYSVALSMNMWLLRICSTSRGFTKNTKSFGPIHSFTTSSNSNERLYTFAKISVLLKKKSRVYCRLKTCFFSYRAKNRRILKRFLWLANLLVRVFLRRVRSCDAWIFSSTHTRGLGPAPEERRTRWWVRPYL